MDQETPLRGREAANGHWEKQANWAVHFFQALFLLIMLLDLDGPFLSAHNERQNQTCDMAQHVFRDGWRSIVTPKESFSLPGYETQHFTAALQEFPFHGVIGWPFALVTRHTRAVMRLISTAFALISIQFLYGILRFWLPAGPSVAGAAVWALAPLVLHFGQVPMPDILCTSGMVAAFWYALRGKLPASSAWFLFAILAKLSVIVFGLPILVALLAARNCRSMQSFLKISVAWGWLPLAGLLLWELLLNWFAPPTPWTLLALLAGRGDWISLVLPSFYKFLLGCLFPFGLGVLGFLGIVFALPAPPKMNPWIKWAIISSNILYLAGVVRKVPEPQYLLPTLVWGAVLASFGFQRLAEKMRVSVSWSVALSLVLLMHVLVVAAFTVDLKASRVPNFSDIEHAAQLLPPDARVVVVYRYYGASAAVWLHRNIIALFKPSEIAERFPALRRLGFTHVVILDIESWHDKKSADGPLALAARLWQTLRGTPPATGANLPGFADPASPFRQYCDRHFSPLFVAPHVVLYSMASPSGVN